MKTVFSIKGTARRKKKVVHRTATTDDKKLQGSLKKLAVNNIPGIEEVSFILLIVFFVLRYVSNLRVSYQLIKYFL